MTEDEFLKLVNTHGKAVVEQCIYVLDNYKGSTGKTYKNDYKAILSWVIDKVKSKPPPQNKNKYNNYEQRNYDEEFLKNLYSNKMEVQ